jgi:hypothetical protein
MSTLKCSKPVLKGRWPKRSTRFVWQVLRGICVLVFVPPRMVREVGTNCRAEEESEFKSQERYNCVRWQI